MNIWLIVIVVMLLSFVVQTTLNSKFNRYSAVPSPHGLTGADVARLMLQQNGITDVKVRPLQPLRQDDQPQRGRLQQRVHSGVRGGRA